MGDMALRFDRFPEAIALLHRLGSLPATLRPLLCHLHVQLADPLYRRFSGELLPHRRAQGLLTLDRATVARWVDALEPGRWSPVTCLKFASNLLATAQGAGLVSGRRDPRTTPVPAASELIVGYALYLLRGVANDGSLTDNAYLRSLGIDASSFKAIAPQVPGIRYRSLGGTEELVFLEPSLGVWGADVLGAPS